MRRWGKRWDLCKRYSLVFAGFYDRAGVEHPRMEPGDRLLLAERLRDAAGRPTLWFNPAYITLATKGRLFGRRIPGLHEVCDGQHTLISDALSMREAGQDCFHAAFHIGTTVERWREATEADVILGTGELVLPTPIALRIPSPDRAVELQPYATPWLVRLQWWHARTPWRDRGIYGMTAERFWRGAVLVN